MMRVGIVEAEQELVIYLDLHHTYFIKVMKLYNHYLCILWMSFYHAIFFKLIKEPLGESRMRIMKSLSSFDPGLHPNTMNLSLLLYCSDSVYFKFPVHQGCTHSSSPHLLSFTKHCIDQVSLWSKSSLLCTNHRLKHI